MMIKLNTKIKWNKISRNEIKKINKVKKTSKVEERTIKRIVKKIDINTN